jgi:hypothetical protein
VTNIARDKGAKWVESGYIKTSERQICSSVVTDGRGNYLSVNFQIEDDKHSMAVQLKLKHELALKDSLLSDFVFKKGKKVAKKRLRFKPYPHNANVYLITPDDMTKHSFHELIELLMNQSSLEVVLYDDAWVEYKYVFTLRKSNSSIQSSLKKCTITP